MKFDEFVSSVQRGVRGVGEGFTTPDEDWMPVIFVETPKRVSIVLLPPALLDDHASKAQLAAIMRAIVERFRARKVAVVTSAWMASLDEQTSRYVSEHGELPDESHQAGNRPDRLEVVHVAVYDAEVAQSWFAEIRRDGVHPPQLAEWQGPVDTRGRLADPIREALR